MNEHAWQQVYTIPTGTKLSVRSAADQLRNWRPHVTSKDVTTTRYGSYSVSYYVFYHRGLLIRVRRE